MAWPTPQEYNEAIQNPQLNVADAELKNGEPELTPIGLPRPISGGFASVYKLKCGPRNWAVRCFLREVPDQQQRYAAISAHLAGARLPYTVGFAYQPEGIRSRGQWYPIVKMEWVEGEPLIEHIEGNLHRPQALLHLADKWVLMLDALRRHQIAHGDLQHGNVLVTGGELKLIDYDGMYVPGLRGRQSAEVGHRNYQHPRRTERDFGPQLDQFAGWLIHLSLIALAKDPTLWRRLGAGDESLLFRREDFQNPARSAAFQALLRSADPQVQREATLVQSLLALDLPNIPPLTAQSLRTAPAPAAPAPPPKTHGRMAPARPAPVAPPHPQPSPAEEWWRGYTHAAPPRPARATAAGLLLPPAPETPTAFQLDWLLDHLGPTVPVRFQPPVWAVRGLLLLLLVLVGTVASLAGQWLPWAGAAALLLATGLLVSRYQGLAEVEQRRALKAELFWSQTEQERLVGAIARLDRQIEEIRVSEQSELHVLQERHAQQRRAERERLGAIDQELRATLDQLAARQKELDQAEQQEAEQALRSAQQTYLRERLTGHALPNPGVLPGLTPARRQRLIAAGICTAADMEGVEITPGGWFGWRQSAVLVGPGGRRVQVKGIGPRLAEDLLAWCRRLELKYRPSMPWALAPDLQRGIEAHSTRRRWLLESQQRAAAERAERQRERVRQESAREQRAIRTRIDSLRSRTAASVQALQSERGDREREEARKRWEISQVQRRLEAYQAVTFPAFLGRLIGLR